MHESSESQTRDERDVDDGKAYRGFTTPRMERVVVSNVLANVLSAEDMNMLNNIILNDQDGCEQFHLNAQLRAKLFEYLKTVADAQVVVPKLMIKFENLSVRYKVSTAQRNAGIADKTQSYETILGSVWNAIQSPWYSIIDCCQSHAREKATKYVLQDLTGVIPPSSMTLVLGKSGSGKTTFLKALADKLSNQGILKSSGKVVYNNQPTHYYGASLKRMLGYISQSDQHQWNLSVSETLHCANRLLNGATTEDHWKRFGIDVKALDFPPELLELMNLYHAKRADLMCHILGLYNCKDTQIGNELHRGISGGERRRVTLGEILIGKFNGYFMDEISNGLDSTTVLKIMQYLKETTQLLHSTMVIALQQPTPEVFELFDEVLLLENGQIIYHGPRNQCLEYFTSIGYLCPTNTEISEFLVNMTDSHYREKHHLPTPIFSNAPSCEELALYSKQKRFISDNTHSLELDASLLRQRNAYSSSVVAQIRCLTRRNVVQVLRDPSYWKFRFFMTAFLGLLYGTIYYQVEFNQPNLVLGVIFACLLYPVRNILAQLSMMKASHPILTKQVQHGFYSFTAAFTALLASECIFNTLDLLIFTLCTYFLSGLVLSFQALITFYISMFLVTVLFYFVYYWFTTVCRDMKTIYSMSTLILIIVQAFSGVTITLGEIPLWLRWLYYINPVGWCLKAVAITQYIPNFQLASYRGVNYYTQYGMSAGEYFLKVPFDLPSDFVWVYTSFGVVLICLFLFVAMSMWSLKYRSILGSRKVTLTSFKKKTMLHEKDSIVLSLASDSTGMYSVPSMQITFKHLSYTAANRSSEPIVLLHDLSGTIRPEKMTALMGTSGAGKSTLLDVLAGRKTSSGRVDGDIWLNGRIATPETMRGMTAYCEQSDEHFPFATVQEELMMNVQLRSGTQPSFDESISIVASVMQLLELETISDELTRSLSAEQGKRLAIGCELVSNPSILFLDEPTTGLDALAAKRIVQGLKRLAMQGRTIVCTIHQPSADVFGMFDDLILLQRGGYMVYHGPCDDVVAYMGGVKDAKKYIVGTNPATYVLDTVAETNQDLVRIQLNHHQVNHVADDPNQLKALPDHVCPQKAPGMTQLTILLKRAIQMQWRSPEYNLNRAFSVFVQNLVMSATLFGSTANSASSVQSQLAFVYVCVIQVQIRYAAMAVPLMVQLRPSFYRQVTAKAYDSVYYTIALMLAEIPFTVVIQLMYTAITALLFDVGGTSNVLWFWLVTSILALSQTAMGYFFVAATPSAPSATIAVILMVSIAKTISGFDPPASALPEVYQMLSYLTPSRYATSALIAKIYAYCPTPGMSHPGCSVIDNGITVTIDGEMRNTYTVQQFVEQYYDMKYDLIYRNLGMVFAFYGIFVVMTILALQYLNFKKT